jgi:hypothetical protein
VSSIVLRTGQGPSDLSKFSYYDGSCIYFFRSKTYLVHVLHVFDRNKRVIDCDNVDVWLVCSRAHDETSKFITRNIELLVDAKVKTTEHEICVFISCQIKWRS